MEANTQVLLRRHGNSWLTHRVTVARVQSPGRCGKGFDSPETFALQQLGIDIFFLPHKHRPTHLHPPVTCTAHTQIPEKQEPTHSGMHTSVHSLRHGTGAGTCTHTHAHTSQHRFFNSSDIAHLFLPSNAPGYRTARLAPVSPCLSLSSTSNLTCLRLDLTFSLNRLLHINSPWLYKFSDSYPPPIFTGYLLFARYCARC